MPKGLARRVRIDPGVMVGKPVIRGTRIPVETIVRMPAQAVTEEGIRRECPRLERDDILAALAYAARALDLGGLPAQGTLTVASANR